MADARSRAARRLAWGAQLFVALFVVWLGLNGLKAWPLGLGVAALGAWIGATFAPGQPQRWRPSRLPAFLGFFLVESLRGSVDVARRAFSPRLPLAPGFVDLPLRLPPGPPVTLMVGLVTLLPGSLSADLDEANRVLRVHLLVPEAREGLDALQQQIARLFGVTLAR